MNNNQPVDPKIGLEVLCDRCNGTRGGHDDEREWYDCCDCGGAGYVPTKFGEKVLDLMRHNFAPMLQETAGK